MRIAYFGTPEFALAGLKALIDNPFEVVVVITAPDKPAGRGLELKASPVKLFAVERGIPVLQPTHLKDPGFISQLASFKADLGVIIAFRMLPEVVWNMFPNGTFNIHASLLPQYRGAAPINHAIINGEKETGVTSFFLKHEIDTGSIISSRKTSIGENETAGELHDRLMESGARLAVETAKLIEAGKAHAIPQTASDNLKHAPKINKEFCKVNFNQDALNVHNHIRGLSPVPGAFAYLVKDDNRSSVKLHRTELYMNEQHLQAGEVLVINNKDLVVGCAAGAIKVLELQPEGKKKMDVKSFLNGFRSIIDEYRFE